MGCLSEASWLRLVDTGLGPDRPSCVLIVLEEMETLEKNSWLHEARQVLRGSGLKQVKPISRSKFNSHSLKESHEKRSTSLNITDTQVKTTMRYFLTWFTMTIVPKLTENKCWRKCGKREPSHAVGEKVK